MSWPSNLKQFKLETSQKPAQPLRGKHSTHQTMEWHSNFLFFSFSVGMDPQEKLPTSHVFPYKSKWLEQVSNRERETLTAFYHLPFGSHSEKLEPTKA